MASNKAGGTWEDLQESLTRVRQQYGLLPRAAWDDLIAMASYEKTLTANHKNRRLPQPFLPSIAGEFSRPVLDRKGIKQPSYSGLHKPNVRRRRINSSSLTNDNRLLKSREWEGTKTSIDVPLQASKYHSKELETTWRSEVLQTSLPHLLLNDLLKELLRELSANVLKMEIKHFVNNYLVETTLQDLMDEMITGIIQSELPFLVKEINNEFEQERWLDNFIQNVTEKEVKDIVTTVLGECDHELSEVQKNQIAVTANKHIVDMFLLEHMLKMVGKYEPMVTEKDSSSCLLDSIMLDVFLKQYSALQQAQQMTMKNFPARNFHQKTFNEVALDVILTELSMTLCEDMEDIFEYEKDIELG